MGRYKKTGTWKNEKLLNAENDHKVPKNWSKSDKRRTEKFYQHLKRAMKVQRWKKVGEGTDYLKVRERHTGRIWAKN